MCLCVRERVCVCVFERECECVCACVCVNIDKMNFECELVSHNQFRVCVCNIVIAVAYKVVNFSFFSTECGQGIILEDAFMCMCECECVCL